MRYIPFLLLFSWAYADCRPEAPQGESADDAIYALRKKLERKDLALAEAQADLNAILQHSCVDGPEVKAWVLSDAPSVPALRTWWENGGESWLDALRERRADPAKHRAVPFPPTMPAAIEPAATARVLACPDGDDACGQATRGWRARIQLQANDQWGEKPSADKLAECEKNAKEAGPADAFASWVACAGAARPKVLHLPPGEYRAPDHGWLLVRGRRGHYSFCDGARLYDLKTGAMYVSESCSQLALVATGKVDHAATNAARDPGRRAGSVPVANLREVLWMLVLAPSTTAGPVGMAKVEPPKWIEEKASNSLFGLGGSFWFSSAQTRLSWVWFDGDKVLADGSLTWPNSSDLAQDHAADLLHVAESGFVPGCPTAAPPQHIPLGPRPAVSGLDARPQDLADAMSAAVKGLTQARAQACQ